MGASEEVELAQVRVAGVRVQREREREAGRYKPDLGRKWENWVKVNISKSGAWKFFLICKLFCGSL